MPAQLSLQFSVHLRSSGPGRLSQHGPVRSLWTVRPGQPWALPSTACECACERERCSVSLCPCPPASSVPLTKGLHIRPLPPLEQWTNIQFAHLQVTLVSWLLLVHSVMLYTEYLIITSTLSHRPLGFSHLLLPRRSCLVSAGWRSTCIFLCISLVLLEGAWVWDTSRSPGFLLVAVYLGKTPRPSCFT